MELVPRRLCPWREDGADGTVVVLAPRFGRGRPWRWLQRALPPQRKHIEVRLEARGSFLWRLSDGSRSMGALATAFGEAFPQDRTEAPRRVAVYLMSMAQNGFVEIMNHDR